MNARVLVEARFYVMPARVWRIDLDNLAKPLLDTLFRPLYPQVADLGLTGALSDQDDGYVFSATLNKHEVATEPAEGLELVVTWRGEQPSRIGQSLISDATIDMYSETKAETFRPDAGPVPSK